MKYKYKVCVYAICKNEEKFVKRWVDSMSEADEIYVLDTGSTDNTKKLLEDNGVFVTTKEIIPWRFDVARNESLKLVPLDTDICVCTDLDEVFTKGWRQALETVWSPDINRVRYSYNWRFNKYNKPDIFFYIEKIHQRHGYTWTHPVHEVLTYNGIEKTITTDTFTLNHYPDHNKSRSSYLSLLELSVAEDPEDDRNMHYLGREYMYYGKYQEAIDTLIKHLHLKKATWSDERCASMRFIARCYTNINRYDEAIMWLNKAIQEAPHLRDPYVELALLYYGLNDYENTLSNCQKALNITKKEKTYINEPISWDHTIYDLMSISFFNLKNYELSYTYANLAKDMDPKNERLIKNVNIIKEYIEKEAK